MAIIVPDSLLPNRVRQRLSSALVWLADVVDFLSRTAWPLIDLLIRIWIGKLALVESVLISTDWSMAVSMAAGSYPMPISGLMAATPLATIIWLAAVFLILGLATRLGAIVLCSLAVASHVQVSPLDLDLFWIATLASYVLSGAGPLSLDRALSQGLKNAPLPLISRLIAVLEAARPILTSLYLLGLRLWLMLTLALGGGHVPKAAVMAEGLDTWLPVRSATLLFGNAGIALALLIGGGLATRVVAVLAVTIIGYHKVMADDMSYPFYWTVLLLLLVARGPGQFSLDELILSGFRRRLPELSGKPTFGLEGLPRVVIVGAGFGGLACARALRDAAVSVTLVDRQNYHLFQPLLYQVATASLSPADIAIPIRSVFREQFNAKVLLANVTGVDTERRELSAEGLKLPYDYLVIATGATHSYFGQDTWAPFAPGLKRVDDATLIRRRLLNAFELAEIATGERERKQLLTFVIVGGGPTGVELAGAIAELARVGMEKDFRNFDPAAAEIILVQAGPRVLPTFPAASSQIAHRSLEEMGVKVLIDSMVRSIDAEGVMVNNQRIHSRTVFWAAGVAASPAAAWLKAEADTAGRVKVRSDLSVAHLQNVYVIGDAALANCWNGKPMPGLAPAAKQGGAFVAKVIQRKLRGDHSQYAFAYRHMGSLATIGRKAAIADFGFIRLHGALAWWLWGLVHILFLLGLRNRVAVAVTWLWSYVTYRPATRLITGTSQGS
jgi:NADH dehydrogenase